MPWANGKKFFQDNDFVTSKKFVLLYQALSATAVKKTRVYWKPLAWRTHLLLLQSPNRKNIYPVRFLDKNMLLISYFQWLVVPLKKTKIEMLQIPDDFLPGWEANSEEDSDEQEWDDYQFFI